VQELLRAWRRCAVQLAEEQWRLFFATGRFDKNHGDTALASVVGAANRLQMCRWHVSQRKRAHCRATTLAPACSSRRSIFMLSSSSSSTSRTRRLSNP
jgi:hypothetical protein